jgi:hypothetical protein
MTEKQQAECTIESDGTGVFVVFEGVRIAKRGESGTPQAGTWVSRASIAERNHPNIRTLSRFFDAPTLGCSDVRLGW